MSERPKWIYSDFPGENAPLYDQIMWYAKHDIETDEKYWRSMLLEAALRKDDSDARLYLWVAKEYENHGCPGAATEWYYRAYSMGAKEGKAGLDRCFNPYNIDQGYDIVEEHTIDNSFQVEKIRKKQQNDFAQALKTLQQHPTREESDQASTTIYRIATAQGCCVPMAEQWMGGYCKYVEKDLDAAAEWYKKAADHGDAIGAACYAKLIQSNNIDESVKYFRLAADLGDAESQFIIGRYFLDTGNRDLALHYLNLASNQQYDSATALLNDITIAKDTRQTTSWKLNEKLIFNTLIRANNLYEDEFVEFILDLYQPEDFCKKAYNFCNGKYGLGDVQRITFEYCMTAFYGSICAVGFWLKEHSAFTDVKVWDALANLTDLEFTDSTAETLMHTSQGEEKAEHIYSMISDYIDIARTGMMATRLDQDACIYSMKLAYKLGMLVAVKEFQLGECKKIMLPIDSCADF